MGEFNSPLDGLIFCKECGAKLHVKRQRSVAYTYFGCANYYSVRDPVKCTTHSIRTDNLEQLVLEELRELISYAKTNRENFVRQLRQMNDKDSERELKAKVSEFNKSEKRVAELDQIIKKTFESNATGKLSDERFAVLLADYEKEQAELKSRVETLREDIASKKAKALDINRFLKLIDNCVEVTELTAEHANTFIKKIEVSEEVRTNGKRTQRISQEVFITYSAIGEWRSPAE